MHHRTQHFAIAILATCLSGGAFAGGDYSKAGHEKSASPAFSRLDTDNNGYVTETEARTSQAGDQSVERLTQEWSELDTNQDGKLDQAEFARFEPVESATETTEQSAADQMGNAATDQMESSQAEQMKSPAAEGTEK